MAEDAFVPMCLERRARVPVMTLDRPEARNADNPEMLSGPVLDEFDVHNHSTGAAGSPRRRAANR